MIQKCQIQEVGHYRTEQKIKLTGAHEEHSVNIYFQWKILAAAD
jgi:hypothetical protein